MHNRAYALAFLIVILMGCSGAYLALRLILGDGSPASGPAWTPLSPLSNIEAVPVTPIQNAASPTRRPTPTPLVIITPAIPTATPILLTPAPSATPMETPAAPTTATTETVAAPAATPNADFGFVVRGPITHTKVGGDCPGDSIRGRVTDRQGNPLAGVRLWLLDEYGNEAFAVSKREQVDLGKYDFPLFGPPRTFYLVVLDSSGHPDSPRVEIIHKRSPNEDANCHYVNWQRTR